jgi:hypothetical protein
VFFQIAANGGVTEKPSDKGERKRKLLRGLQANWREFIGWIADGIRSKGTDLDYARIDVWGGGVGRQIHG